jgi:hypothetical protein
VGSFSDYRHHMLKIGIPFTLLAGAYNVADALATHTIHWDTDVDLSPANAPVQFWSVVLGMTAVTVIGTWLSIRYWRFIWGDWADLGINRHKIYQYLALFSVLLVIYSVCLSSYLKFVSSAPEEIAFGDLMGPLVKFCIIAAVPFGVLAYADKTWRASDAGPVCAVAWIAACACLWPKYGEFCPFGLALPFFPFIFCALLAHTVGRIFPLRRFAAIKSDFRP